MRERVMIDVMNIWEMFKCFQSSQKEAMGGREPLCVVMSLLYLAMIGENFPTGDRMHTPS